MDTDVKVKRANTHPAIFFFRYTTVNEGRRGQVWVGA